MKIEIASLGLVNVPKIRLEQLRKTANSVSEGVANHDCTANLIEYLQFIFHIVKVLELAFISVS